MFLGVGVEGGGDVAIAVGLDVAGLEEGCVEAALFLHFDVLSPGDGVVAVVGCGLEPHLTFCVKRL